MPRDLTSPQQTVITLGRVIPVTLADITLDTGVIRLNSTDRNFTWSGELWYGCGALGAVSSIQETSQLQASSIQLSLSGVTAEYIQTVMGEQYQGKQCRVWIGFLDDSYSLVYDPTLVFQGIVDQMSLSVGQRATVTLTAQNELARWETPNIRRYTDADQQRLYPGDTGMRWVPQAAEKEIYWGSSPANAQSQTGGGGPSFPVDYTLTNAFTVGTGEHEGPADGKSDPDTSNDGSLGEGPNN
jgi:hypothetical protein